VELLRATADIDGFVESLSPGRRETVQALRGLIARAAPDLTEAVRWEVPVFAGRSNVLAILVYDREVHLVFFGGVRLRVTPEMLERTGITEEPHLLQGVGDRVRFLRLKGPGDVEPQTAAELVRQASQLDRGAGTIP
jgi:hypothetical protein